ncbi:putative DNA-binding domain-containing protein [Zhengella sp. ZM62]|uniref:HvfC/BufC family peptide modification chaperone n=1 Tax=Zhengella sedimenti TaxID=3390035 RepID=UPI003976EAA4
MTGPTLAQLQASMQAAIKDGDDAALALIAAPPHNSRAERLATYREAYRLRLAGILRDDYDALHAFLGDEQFDLLSQAYIDACPSTTRNARWYGERFAAFAGGTEPWSRHPVIGDLAALQWALSCAFDAPDGAAAGLDDMARVPPEAAMGMRLHLHPSLQLLDLSTNAASIFGALRQDEPPPAPEFSEGGAPVLVWRMEMQARYRPLDPEEAMLLRETRAGAHFGLLCEMAAMMDDPDNAAMRVAGYLRGWVETGLVSRFALANPS